MTISLFVLADITALQTTSQVRTHSTTLVVFQFYVQIKKGWSYLIHTAVTSAENSPCGLEAGGWPEYPGQPRVSQYPDLLQLSLSLPDIRPAAEHFRHHWACWLWVSPSPPFSSTKNEVSSSSPDQSSTSLCLPLFISQPRGKLWEIWKIFLLSISFHFSPTL